MGGLHPDPSEHPGSRHQHSDRSCSTGTICETASSAPDPGVFVAVTSPPQYSGLPTRWPLTLNPVFVTPVYWYESPRFMTKGNRNGIVCRTFLTKRSFPGPLTFPRFMKSAS